MALTGLAHCGHCGWRMYGERHRHRHYYTCSGNKSRPGICRYYTVREDRLLGALVRKLQEVYLAPERLEGLGRALLARVRAKGQASPERALKLRARLEALDRDIRQGARNLVRATDNLDLIQDELTTLRGQRERTQRELDAAEREQGVPVTEQERKVAEAVARLATLGQELGTASTPRLRAVLGLMVSRVDLYWEEPEQKAKNKWNVFAKGVVKLRPYVVVSGSVTPASTARWAGCRRASRC
jgi:hypothetical protein